MPSYWIVGATVQNIDMSGRFIEGGFWFADQPNSQNDIAQIQVDDRLIIKKGFASPVIEIKAVGTVKGIESFPNTSGLLGVRMVFVSWLDLRSENHTIPSRGMFGAVHGPLARNDAAVTDALSLL